jgi:hypothetical protein
MQLHVKTTKNMRGRWFLFGGGKETKSTTGLLYQPQIMDECGAISGREKLKYSEETCSSPILSTTNSTWPDPSSNLGRQGGKPATNHLNYSTALM